MRACAMVFIFCLQIKKKKIKINKWKDVVVRFKCKRIVALDSNHRIETAIRIKCNYRIK